MSGTNIIGTSDKPAIVPAVVDDFARKWIAGHYLIVFALLVILVVLWLWAWYKGEHFNPTATLKYQVRDGLGEHLDSGAPICSSTSPMTEDPWGWAFNVAKGPGETFEPKNDNQFSRILAGH